MVTIGHRSLRKVCPHLSKVECERIARHLAPAMKVAGINTELRAAAFIAQLAHESDGFRARREYASGAAYEGRKDLGNTYPGDGKRYRGRGWVQVTGRTNYVYVTRLVSSYWVRIERAIPWVNHKPDFVRHPYKLESHTWASVASALWWKDRGCNKLADRGWRGFRPLTKQINGGYNGWASRVRYYRRARKVAPYLVPKRR